MPQRIEVPGMGIVEFPDGMSDDQIASAIRAQMGTPAAPAAMQGASPSALSRFGAGLADQVQGGAQMLENAVRSVSPGTVQAINNLNNKLAEWGIVAPLPPGGVQQQTREREQALKTEGMDWPRLAGNVLSPANLAIASRIPAAAGVGARVLGGAGAGAVAAGTLPADDEQARLGNMAAGAAGGAAIPALTAGVGRLISPAASTNPQLALLRAEGIRPTVGQALGGMANKAEEKAISLPFMGDAIATARQRGAADLNRAVANRALAPIGEQAPAGVVGRDLVSAVQRRLSDAYNRLLPGLTVRADQQFARDVGTLRNMVATGSIDPNASRAFQRILQNDVLGKFRGQNALTGETMKAIESDLTERIARLGASTDADQRLVADALREVQDSLRQLVQRNNPQQARELRAINTGWANYKRLERAAAGLGAEDGVFNSAQLLNAIKALDRSKDKRAFAHGDALMQDLGDAAKGIMGSKVPNSGTADRLMNAGAIASGLFNPAIPVGLLAGAGAYSPQVQRALLGAVSSRPQAAQPIADLFNRTAPMLSPAGGLLALDAFQ